MAPARMIQSFLPLLKKSKSPHVVNISSMAGFQGSKKFPGLSHYSASKAAIAALTESLAEEFNQEIAFNALCLGAVQTEMLEEAFPGYQAPLNPDEMAEYIADFAYLDDQGLHTVEDVKGKITTEYLIKKKMFLKKYGVEVIFKELFREDM